MICTMPLEKGVSIYFSQRLEAVGVYIELASNSILERK